MDPFQLQQIASGELSGQVVRLTPDQRTGTRGMRQLGAAARRGGCRCDVPGQNLERAGQQSVTGQDRQRFTVSRVAGGNPPPQLVVVHRRQVIVDQRIGVHHFDGHGRRHRRLR